jgi:hypothetical protein
MFAICLTAWNRPGCLGRLLDSLCRLRGLAGWQLFVQVEPSAAQAELLQLLRGDGLPCVTHILCNPVLQGVRANPLLCLERAWDHGARAFLLLEDDLEVSADALEFVEHCLRVPDWDLRYACGNLHFSTCFNHAHLQHWEPCDKRLASTALETFFLSSLGLFFSRAQYERFIRQHWWDTPLRFRSFDGSRVAGWDCALNQALLLSERPCLQSLLPRVRHHGIDGVHSDAVLHQRSYAHAGLHDGIVALPELQVCNIDQLNAGFPGGDAWGVLLRMASQLWTLQRTALQQQLELERCARQLKGLLDLT